MWLFTPETGARPSDGLDRGLQFGDGLFETMLLQNGKIISFTRHLARLEKGVVRLALPVEINLSGKVLQAVDALMQGAQRTSGVLKLIYTRGNAGRGYLPVSSVASWYLTLSDLPVMSATALTLGIAQTQASIQQQLAGLKHLNRLENVLARIECAQQGCDEVLMLNAFDEVIEASAHNIFCVIDGRLYTPGLQHSGVRGVMRERIINYCQIQQIECIESIITRDMLPRIDAMMLSNSVFGPRRINALAGRALTQSPMINTIIRAYESGALNE
jgi:4-amino-4-deoxychorismate lyase